MLFFRTCFLCLLFIYSFAQAHTDEASWDVIVSADWLNQHLNDPDLVVLDATVYFDIQPGRINYISGEDIFLQGHIPGAQFANLLGAFSAPSNPLPLTLPSPDQLKHTLQITGISNQSKVVIYSTDNHTWATRLWWMLRWAGHEQVAILDGGFEAWTEQGFPVEQQVKNVSPTQYHLKLNNSMIADQQAVHDAITNDDILLIDALPLAHYEGDFSLYGRPGHIPTAVNVSAAMMVNFKRSFISPNEVELMLDHPTDTPIITYCGGGVSASSVAFNLLRAGFKDVAVYMGSLQEWVLDESNPLTTANE